jgi:hypothetical protein
MILFFPELIAEASQLIIVIRGQRNVMELQAAT